MFKVTQAAATQIQDSASNGGAEGMALRLAAIKHDDGSYDYKMGYDEVSEDDISFKSEEVMIVIAPEYVPLLDETTLDYVEMDDGQRQFIFLNPKDVNFVPPQTA
jgi:iron-sulfur cluster assembly protein